jgi:hypothetical protein
VVWYKSCRGALEELCLATRKLDESSTACDLAYTLSQRLELGVGNDVLYNRVRHSQDTYIQTKKNFSYLIPSVSLYTTKKIAQILANIKNFFINTHSLARRSSNM